GVRLDRLVAAAVAGRPQPLGLEAEALADQGGVQRGDVCGDGGHAVLAAAHRDVPVALRVLVAAGLAARIGLRDRGGTGVVPFLGARAVEIRQALAEEAVRLSTL